MSQLSRELTPQEAREILARAGRNAVALRAKNGISTRAMSISSGGHLSPSTISRIERGVGATITSYMQLARCLGVTIDYLLTEDLVPREQDSSLEG